MTEQNEVLTSLRDNAIRNQHVMTPWRTVDNTTLTQCRNCSAVIYRITGAYGGTAHILQCATVAYQYIPLTTHDARDKRDKRDKRDALGYSTGTDDGTQCVNCGRGSTLVGRQCYDCGYTIPRAYTVAESTAPEYIVYHDTYETTQYRITEHVYVTDDTYVDDAGKTRDVKLTYSTRDTIRAMVRSEHGERYQYLKTVKKPYIAPCGTPCDRRHVYILDNDASDTLSVVYRYPCRDRCTHRKRGQ